MSGPNNCVSEGLLCGQKLNNLNHGIPTSSGEGCYVEHHKLQDDIARLRKHLYIFNAALVILFIVIITIITIFFVKLGYDIVNHSHKPKVGEEIYKILEQEELCVPCKDMRLGPSVEENRMLDQFKRKKDPDLEDEQCCIQSPKQLMSSLQMYIERMYREEMARGNLKIPASEDNIVVRPAAHLMGPVYNNFDQPIVPGQQISISSWISDEDLAFTNQMSYRHGRIVVPSSGLYYVYSQVSFMETFPHNKIPDFTTTSNSLSHYIYRYNVIYRQGGEELLIQNSMTKCWDEKRKFGEYTSYLGALFHLRRSDEIFVKVSNLTMMMRHPKQNYFGIFKISNL